jgi:hypothetical protein
VGGCRTIESGKKTKRKLSRFNYDFLFKEEEKLDEKLIKKEAFDQHGLTMMVSLVFICLVLFILYSCWLQFDYRS